eukprot:TRINITY_DN11973_c0_g1_i2.p1 TRINITY_DN11973_c0_g1~~TRINITY_DN11973_c0_g1_i2.p1  ORF type:complete len:245 (+),score=84.66 TRINITY_DN11973_c0_g1_i2:22-735(+)
MSKPSPNVTTHAEPNVEFETPQGSKCPGYISSNSKDSTIGLVVIQEWWGLNKNIQHHVDEFGTRGFMTICPDLFRGKVAQDAGEAHHLLTGLDWPKAVDDIRGAIQYLKKNGAKKVGVLGFCMGGALTIASSQVPEIDAAVPFYGIPDLSSINWDNVKIPFQLHFGQKDDMKGFSDPESAKKLENLLKEKGKKVELFLYENAGHAFNNMDRPEAYNREASQLAFQRAEQFLKKEFSN